MLRCIKALMLSVPLSVMAQADLPYSADFSTGIIPAEISVSNVSGLRPDAGGYKRGWTADGWTVDRYGDHGYVALSPTYTGTTDACENVLALPAMDLTPGCFLTWQALSVHPDFREAYRVEITAGGNTRILYQTEAEEPQWTTRMADLTDFAGQKATISFVCTSCNRYMLALSDITVGQPSGLSIETHDCNPVFYGPQESAGIRIEALNTGAAITAGVMSLAAGEGFISSSVIERPWQPGEIRSFTLEAPLSIDAITDYKISFKADGNDQTLNLGGKSIYSTSFTKTLLVDKATGMWCTNCPEGILQIEALERRFGSAAVALDTHCAPYSGQADPLANSEYFAKLGFSSVPTLMLDRIAATAATDAAKFTDYYFTPAEFGLEFSALTLRGNDTAELGITVKSASAVDNSTDRYRVAYVLTADIYSPENSDYFQRNNCTKPSDERFFYLPAKIPSRLCVFHNVTLSSATAFDGIPGSLPAVMEPDHAYHCSFSVDRPEIVSDINDLSVAAIILDTSNGHALAARKLRVGDAGFAGLRQETTTDSHQVCARISAGNMLTITLPTAEIYRADIFTTDGKLCARLSGNGPQDSHLLNLPAGFYVLRMESYGRTYTLKFTL